MVADNFFRFRPHDFCSTGMQNSGMHDIRLWSHCKDCRTRWVYGADDRTKF